MAIYTEKWPTVYALNTITELELTTSQNISSNYTRVNYVVRVKKVNNWNDNWTPSSGGSYLALTIGGTNVRNGYRSNWTTANNAANATAVVDSGYVDVYHNADGTRVIDYRMELNPNVATIRSLPNRVISGSFTAATIPRASSFTVNSTTLTTGSNYTVSIARASTAFTHRIYRKIGNSEVELTSSAVGTSHTINMPHSLFNSYPNSSSISASIIVRTFSGATQIGSSSQNVTINLVSTAVPTNSSTTVSNSDSKPFSSANQMVRGISRLTLGTGTVAGSYSSTITSYEFSYQQVGGDWSPAASSSTRTYTYPAFNFPNSGSVALNIRSRVRDSRGRYSNWATVNSALRVHHYAPPSIESISVRRAGSGNTTLQVYRSHSVTPLYEGGNTSSQKNTANLRFQTREPGGTTASNNAGGSSTSLSTSAAWVNLSGAFTASKSYQVRAVLSDARQTVYGSWISVGTEFVPLDVGPRGVGVGKVHSDGSADLEVGTGGIDSEGPVRVNGVTQEFHKRLIGNTDPSTLITSGAARIGYRHTSLPPGSDWSQMLTIYGGADTITQMVFPYYNTGNPWVRSGNPPEVGGGGSYGPWRQLAFTSDIPSIPAIPPSGAATTGAVSGRGRWFQTGDLLICTQVAFINDFFSAYSLTGSWTYPKAFAEAPFVQVAGGHDGMDDALYRMTGELSAYNVTSTGTSVHFAGGPFSSGNSKKVYMLAIGRV